MKHKNFTLGGFCPGVFVLEPRTTHPRNSQELLEHSGPPSRMVDTEETAQIQQVTMEGNLDAKSVQMRWRRQMLDQMG